MPNVTPKPGVPVAMKVVIFGAPLVGILIGAMHFVQKGQIDACNKGEAKGLRDVVEEPCRGGPRADYERGIQAPVRSEEG